MSYEAEDIMRPEPSGLIYVKYKKKNNKGELQDFAKEVSEFYKLKEKEQIISFEEFSRLTLKEFGRHVKKNIQKIKKSEEIDEFKKLITHNDIWNEIQKKDGSTKKIFLPNKAAEWLLQKYNFLTIGEKRPEIWFYNINKGIYEPNAEKLIAAQIQKATKGVIKNNQVLEVIGQIQRQTYENRNILEPNNPNLICVANGILNLKERKLIPHSEKYIFTQQININYIQGSRCYNFKKFLKDILDEKDIPVLQEFLGFLLYRDYFIKKAALFYGEPDTGKTTLIKAIVRFIGEENTSGISLHKILTDKFASVNLYGKLLNFYDDLSFKDIKQTGEFKIITGGGYISGERKFGERFHFINYSKLLFAANKISSVEDTDDDAYYSRWLLFQFNQQFIGENVDRNIIEKITTKEELEGILIWAIEGLHRLLEKGHFSYRWDIEENKQLMESSSNSVSSFVIECVEQAEKEHITKDNLYKIYTKYCTEKGISRVTKDKFGKTFHKKCKYTTETRHNKERCWENIKLKGDIPGIPSNLSLYIT